MHHNIIQGYIGKLQVTLSNLPLQSICDLASLLHQIRLKSKQVFILGNGGSAATASHFACDLSKNTIMNGLPCFRVISLTDNTSIFSAYANDEGYKNVFVGQLINLLQPGDVVIGISASGNSINVLRAIELAKETEATTVGFTGFDGGQLRSAVDFSIHVPSQCIEHVEDIHLMLAHLICVNLRSVNEIPTLSQCTSIPDIQ